jgi:hypothetical protein
MPPKAPSKSQQAAKVRPLRILRELSSLRTATDVLANIAPIRPRSAFSTVISDSESDEASTLDSDDQDGDCQSSLGSLSVSGARGPSSSKKRKPIPTVSKVSEDPQAKKVRGDLRLRPQPLHQEDAPKITLVSSDGKKLCVDRLTLSVYR